MALLMAFSGAGLGVPVALGDGHGNGPNGAGPPGQLAKQNAGNNQGNGQGQGNGKATPPGLARDASGVAPAGQKHGNGNGNGHRGHGNGASHGSRRAAAAAASNGNGPNGNGPPGQNGSRGAAAKGPRATAAAARNGAGSSQGNSPRSGAAAAAGNGSSPNGLHPRSRSAATTIPVPVTTLTQATARQTSLFNGSGSTTAQAGSGGGIGTLDITSAGTGSLAAASGTNTGSRGGRIAGTLAPGTAAIGLHGTTTGHATRLTHHRVHISIGQIVPFLVAAPKGVIEVLRVIPTGVWIALAVALALAAGAGAAAVRSRRQVRLQASEVAAVTAAALTDPLTGVLNRRGFLEAGERELDRARRYGHPLALAFVDIRGLKAVNDTEGHLAGDRLLKRVTMLLRESARTHDLVGRIGGDELAVLLAEQSADGAEAMTQRVRAQIPAYRASLGLVTGWDVTIGTSTFPEDGDDLEQLLDAADRRLYLQRGIDLAK